MSSKDDKVEAFFRKASNHYKELDVNEGDWRKMEAMLDADAARRAAIRSKRRSRGAAAAGVVVMLMLTTYFLLPDDKSAALESIAGNGTDVIPELSPEIKEGNASVSDNEGIEEIDTPLTPAVDSERNRSSGRASVSSDPNVSGNVNRKPDGKVASAPPLDSQKAIEPLPENHSGHDMIRVKEKIIEDNQPDVGFSLNPPDHLNQQINEKGSEANPSREEIRTPPDDKLLTSEKEVNHVEEMAGDDGPAIREPSRWSVSLLAAPDFSTTPNSSYTSPGNAFGIAVHFSFANRWTVNTGALYSEKKYWGYGYEYHPPYNYWKAVTNGVVPDRIDGNCDVIEVPLSVAFNLIERDRSRAFVSAGISSYFMQSEYYTYTFDSPNPGAANGWSTEKPSTYWFGIGSLSVGYDWRVTSSLSLGVEPYLKIPFEEIGWANIDLFSTGILFAARYRFFKGSHERPPINAP